MLRTNVTGCAAGAHDPQAGRALAGRAAAAQRPRKHVVEESCRSRRSRRSPRRSRRCAGRSATSSAISGSSRIAKSIDRGDEARAEAGERELDLDALGRGDREAILEADGTARAARRCSYSDSGMDVDRFTRERAAGWEELAGLVRAGGLAAAAASAPSGCCALGGRYRSAAADLALARRLFPGDPRRGGSSALVADARQRVYADRGAPPVGRRLRHHRLLAARARAPGCR